MWTQQLIDQLNLAHVARKDVKKLNSAGSRSVKAVRKESE